MIVFLWVVYGVVKDGPAILVDNAMGTVVYGLMAIGIIIQAAVTF